MFSFPKLCTVINVSSFLFLEFLLQWWEIALRCIELLFLCGALLAFKKKDEQTNRRKDCIFGFTGHKYTVMVSVPAFLLLSGGCTNKGRKQAVCCRWHQHQKICVWESWNEGMGKYVCCHGRQNCISEAQDIYWDQGWKLKPESDYMWDEHAGGLWLGGGCWVTFRRRRFCLVTVHTALVPPVPQQFNYTGLHQNSFFWLSPTFPPKSSSLPEAKDWILHCHHMALLHLTHFTKESAVENCQKEVDLVSCSAFKMFSEHCVCHNKRSARRHRAHGSSLVRVTL